MQIFVTDPSPHKSAIVLDDKRLNKAILESAQILSTVLHTWDSGHKSEVYKPTHVNHPCVTWAGRYVSHYAWLVDHLHFLIAEYRHRKMKDHATSALIETFDKLVPNTAFVPEYFCNCTPYRGNVHASYRKLLNEKWDEDNCNGNNPTWTRRKQPKWRHTELKQYA